MAISEVKEYFSQFGMSERIIELEESSATVDLAAAALHTEPDRIAKTLSFFVGEQPILILSTGKMKIDNAKYRHTFGTKAKMIPFDQVNEIVGHPVGGVCPFAIHEGIQVYLDESLKRYATVFPACGSGNSAIELTIAELEEHSHFLKWVDVCKPME